jgi:transcriptional regulator with XRE-family HTH domain
MMFGKKLRQLRLQSGKSQREVADEMKMMFPEMRISQTSLSALELREDAPRGDILRKLATYYNIPITFFVRSQSHVNVMEYIQRLRLYSPTDVRRFVSEQAASENDYCDDEYMPT